MSIDLVRLVLSTDVGPATKRLTLVALAEAANGEGVCWPSIERLAEQVGAHRVTVGNSLAALVEEGLVSKEVRYSRRGRDTVYTVHVEAVRARVRGVANHSPGSESLRSESLPTQRTATEHVANRCDDVANHCASKEEPPRTTKEPVPNEPSPKVRRATQLPKSWAPTDDHRQRASALGLDLADEADTFRLHAGTHERTTKNWNLAFTMWLKKAPSFQRRNGHPPSLGDPNGWLRGEWTAGRTKPIQERTGLVYHPPDIPLGLDEPGAVEAYLREAARQWITTNRTKILERLTPRSAP